MRLNSNCWLPVGLCLFLLLGATPARAAASCEKLKLGAGGRAAAALARCHVTAAKENVVVDPACVSVAVQKLADAFAMAEARGGCPGNLPVADVDWAITTLIDDLVGLVSSTAGSYACDAKLIKASGRAVRRLFGSRARHSVTGRSERLVGKSLGTRHRVERALAAAANRGGCTALPEPHLYLRRYQDLCPLWSNCSHTVGSFSCGCNAGQAVDWDQPVQLATAVDLNPDPDIVEVNIEAVEAQVEFTPGVVTPVYTFNGTVPGPTIEAKIGDTVIAHFTNNLSEETMVHWHGVEVPALADGSPLSQEPVPPGGTFDYQFTVNRASLFWYHPHVRTNEQLERGMHGALLVRDTATDDSLELPPDELLLVLDDVLLDAAGEVEPPWPDDPADRASTQLNGREGNVFLVNGRETPTVQVRPGVPVRMRMVNVANARFYRLSIDGHEMYRVGGDGGLVEEPVALPAIGKTMGHHGMMMVSDPDPSQGIMMVPGERADIVFTPVGREGDVLELRWHDFPRGRHSAVVGNGGMIEVSHAHDDGERMPVTVMKFELIAGERRQEPWLSPGSLVDIDSVDATGTPVMPVTFGHGMPDMAGDVMFFATMVNGVGVPFSQLTVEQAHAATVGDVRTWEVTNMTGGDHPFHTHGFAFQHLETEYIDMLTPENNRVVPAARVEDKDSFRVPKRPGAKGTSRTVARFAVRFDDSGREGQVAASGKAPGVGTSGGWLLHCHTLEHAARGMMTFLNLYEPLP